MNEGVRVGGQSVNSAQGPSWDWDQTGKEGCYGSGQWQYSRNSSIKPLLIVAQGFVTIILLSRNILLLTLLSNLL